MPYKFVARTDSYPFEKTCDAVKNGRSRLNWATRMITGDQELDFNEVLVLAYMEAQKIGVGRLQLAKLAASLTRLYSGMMTEKLVSTNALLLYRLGSRE